MKRLFPLLFVLICAHSAATAQDKTAASPIKVQSSTDAANDARQDFGEFSFVLPSPTWKITSRTATAAANNIEFVYGDRMDGFLQLRKLKLDDKQTLADLIDREQTQKLQFLPAFVAGKEENFSGVLNGKTANYEFTQAGKPMIGRAYFLQADDNKTVYLLRFTGQRDKLKNIRNQTDSIARTFKVKKN